MKREKKIVLLVEEPALMPDTMIPLLRADAGIELVVHAGTYKEALGVLECLQSDFILLDIHLRDKSGMQLLEYVRANYRQIIIFMMTGQASERCRHATPDMQRFFDTAAESEQFAEAV